MLLEKIHLIPKKYFEFFKKDEIVLNLIGITVFLIEKNGKRMSHDY